MPELLRMPEVEAGAETATLCDWIVRESQQYAASDVLATIETDKAVVDFTADSDGVLIRVLVSPGTEARVGAPIALIARAGEVVEDVDAALASLSIVTPRADRPSVALTPASEPPKVSVLFTPVVSVGASGERPATAVTHGDTGRVFSSPLARRLANEAGLSTESIIGTGPNGRIVRHDVELAIAARQVIVPPVQPVAQTAAARTVSAPPAVPERRDAVLPSAGEVIELPHSRVRRAIAGRLTESKQTIPHWYMRGSARVDELLELRTRLNEASPVKISVNDLILKAAARAHQLVPAMNVLWTEDCIRRMPTVDIGAAVATESGLVTPVLRGVEAMSIAVVAATTRDFVERSREGRLHQHELEGGCSTVTNLGMFATEEFAAIINPPQSSILAIGAVRKEPVLTRKGKVRPRSVLHMTLSVDHRPIDGATAAQWMQALVEVLEHPVRILV